MRKLLIKETEFSSRCLQKVNLYSFISALRSCSNLSNIEFGKQVHSHVIKDSFYDDAYVGTALIDMYAMCGCMEDVEVIFNNLWLFTD